MRPHLLISALVILPLLSGCEKERVDYGGERRPISFSSLILTETKAFKPNDPTVLISVGNQAGVFGTRVVADVSEEVFYNRILKCDAVPDPLTMDEPYSSIWNYSPLKYWEDTGNYYFTAVFPYATDNARIDNTYYLNVSYLAGSNNDLMVARAYQNAAVSKDPVNLTFKHATAAVRFLFGKSSSSASDSYALTGFQLESLASAGTLKVITRISDASENVINLADWSRGALSTLASWNADVVGDRKAVPHPADPDDPDDYLEMGWYYMVPQQLNADSAVTFSVAYNDEDPVETTLNISNRDGTPGLDTWHPNCVYNYYITLTKSGLELTVKTVPWDKVDVTTESIMFEG